MLFIVPDQLWVPPGAVDYLIANIADLYPTGEIFWEEEHCEKN